MGDFERDAGALSGAPADNRFICVIAPPSSTESSDIFSSPTGDPPSPGFDPLDQSLHGDDGTWSA